MTHQEASRIVAVILAMCPSQADRLDSERARSMVDGYADLLSDLTYEQCNAAVRAHFQTNKWMPSIAEIRSAVLEVQIGPVRAGGDAWGDFLAEVSRTGAYRAPSFTDPLVDRVVRAFGWRELCLSENAVADRARFIELYDSLAKTQRREQQSPLLAAAAERRKLNDAQKTLRQVARVLVRATEPDDD